MPRPGIGRLGWLCAVALLGAAGPVASEPAVAGTPPGGAAAESDTLRISLADAIARGRAAAPRLRELRALADAAVADARAARAARLPALDLRAGYARWSDVPEMALSVPGQPARTLFANLPDNWTSRASLTLPLWTGGRLASAVRAGEQQAQAALGEARAGEAALALETIAAYWDLAVARQREQVVAAAIGAYDAHAADARNRFQFGMAARHELLAIEVERDRAQLARLRAAGDRLTAQAELARLLDLPADQTVVPADTLGAAREAADDTSATPAVLVAEALAARPERAALAARAAAAQAQVGVARAARLPQVVLTAGYDDNRPNRRIVPPRDRFDDSWDVGVSLSLNVFDGGRAAAGSAAAAARAAAAAARLSDLDRLVRLDVTTRRVDLGTARAAARVAARALAAAAEARRVAADRYREGLIPSSELLDAESALLRAGLDHAEALAGERLAAAALDRALGRDPGR